MIVPQDRAVTSPVPNAEFHVASVPKMVAAQAARRPDAMAVSTGDRGLTYHELDCQASRLARHLRSLGVGADVLVGLCLPRSLDMVVGALGILKAGGAYVPMDPAYPADRLAFMLDDAGVSILLTQERLLDSIPEGERC